MGKMSRRLLLAAMLFLSVLVALAAASAAESVTAQAGEQVLGKDTGSNANENGEVLTLPGAASSDEGPVPKLEVGGKLIFDTLGPIIINSDGTTRRITNWDKLTEYERELTLRKIRQRNNERREKLEVDTAPKEL
ncbi:Hypothetical Protein FCC1311_060442 [Hondaea fermentalgiana]|uniref:Uncharacterized protein n=1 Tax=Hondaea fermentalgiana TaxID=2315210 RepID=A0A2R5GPL9_9STRA|nr:Hypothetical Protein FCC1311_060442 [Hondaea fermentalgiana]|eukprot:GBG29824.1 Hypothetical Protein FCC1311_060442 [Hondaea fermentalgiana]